MNTKHRGLAHIYVSHIHKKYSTLKPHWDLNYNINCLIISDVTHINSDQAITGLICERKCDKYQAEILTLKRQSRLQLTTDLATSFPIFKNKIGTISHENHLPADDSHEISCLICYFFEIAAELETVVCCKL